jgi:hypothetical protein
MEHAANVLSATAATQVMWEHFKINKALYIPNVREYRTCIVNQLMAGVSVERAFERFLLEDKTSQTPPRAVIQDKKSKAEKNSRAPWPFS